ncbi:hypothetical protein MHEI_46360 [Mycobacterium heidelbergense]|nr:hypothetical protein MHEI_46360 [Mycobacterium heidelbergense]
MGLAWRSPPPRDVVAHEAPGGESHSHSWVLETSGQLLEGLRKQPIVTVHELDTRAPCEFYAFVVVSVEAEPRLITYQSVSGPEHCCGNGSTII